MPLTDKVFWHRYDQVYKTAFGSLTRVDRILEFGVFRGESIRWLRQLYPEATIVGVDIVTERDEWPRDDKIQYVQLDQGNTQELRALASRHKSPFDLVIEDGSHHPQHQKNCLVELLPGIRAGGVYVLEDIHTSSAELRAQGVFRPGAISFATSARIASVIPASQRHGYLPLRLMRVGESLWSLRRKAAIKFEQTGLASYLKGVAASRRSRHAFVNPLSVLLAIERARMAGRRLSEEEVITLSVGPYFTHEEVRLVDSLVKDVMIYQRTGLPVLCHSCHGMDFDYASMTCRCGVYLATQDDSMTAVLILE